MSPDSQNPLPPQVSASPQAPTLNSKKKLIIIVGVSAAVVLVVVVIAAILLYGSKPKDAKPVVQKNTNQVGGPSEATSSSVQQSDDAISQYLSSLDDSKDFPAKALDNTTLNLQ